MLCINALLMHCCYSKYLLGNSIKNPILPDLLLDLLKTCLSCEINSPNFLQASLLICSGPCIIFEPPSDFCALIFYIVKYWRIMAWPQECNLLTWTTELAIQSSSMEIPVLLSTGACILLFYNRRCDYNIPLFQKMISHLELCRILKMNSLFHHS